MHGAGIVHGFISHAGRHRSVADDGDHVVARARQRVRNGDAEPGRHRGRGMRRSERVVLALGAFGESRKTAATPQRPDTVAPAGQDLMRIGLMPDVPDQPVVRRFEDIMERDGEFDHAQTGTEMAAGDGDGIDRLVAQFVGDLRQICFTQAT